MSNQVLKTVKWNGDYPQVKSTANAFDLDIAQMQIISAEMLEGAKRDRKHSLGFSISTTHTFECLWTYDPRFQALSDFDAKVLYVVSSRFADFCQRYDELIEILSEVECMDLFKRLNAHLTEQGVY